MVSDNPSGGDNQQETASTTAPLAPEWVCGFVDGEGCFSVSIHSNPHVRRTRGWQVYPVFQVSQHERQRAILEELAAFFGVGSVRSKGARSSVAVYTVPGVRALEERILPFFERYPLRVKRGDFELFARIVRSLRRKEHLTCEGLESVIRLAYSMNQAGKQRSRTLEEVLAGSSETVREAHPTLLSDAMIQSEPHGDMGSQAEMTWPASPSGT